MTSRQTCGCKCIPRCLANCECDACKYFDHKLDPFVAMAEKIYIPWNTNDDQFRYECRRDITEALRAVAKEAYERGLKDGQILEMNCRQLDSQLQRGADGH
jgi:hypothetical protein